MEASVDARLICHDIAKQHDVPGIDAHAMLLHDELNLINDRLSSRLNPKNFRHLNDMVGRRMLANNAWNLLGVEAI